MWMPTAGAGTNSIASMSCGGTAVIVAGTIVTSAGLAGSQEMFYILSSTSGTTTCTFNTTNAMNSGGVAAMAEYSTTTPGFVFDNAGGRDQNTTTNPAGITLTLSGSNDVIVQSITPNASCSAISGSYTNPALFPGGWGFAGIVNTASGTAPTWTCSSGVTH
jgi:hypothetical protein